MTPPSVSIVMALYRSRPDHLQAALRSALAQSHASLEVMIADDSPDDRLAALVAAFADPRLRYQHNAQSLGVARNHWQAMRRARGEYLLILNHDDWLAPTFVERMSAALRRHPEAVLAFSDHWVIDAGGRRLDRETETTSRTWGRSELEPGLHRSFAHLVARQSVPMAMGTMFRRCALPQHLPDQAGPAYDLWLSYLLCRGGGAAYYVPERLSAWRTHADNLTSAGGLDWLHGAASCWQAMVSDPQFSAVRRLARRRAWQAWVACARRAWSLGKPADSLGFVWRALRGDASSRGLA